MENNEGTEFKRPILIGKIGKLPRKVECKTATTIELSKSTEEVKTEIADEVQQFDSTKQSNSEISLSYTVPDWSGLPLTDREYAFDVLKSGKIIDNIDLSQKPFWVFGRLPDCDMIMAHPTISRYHAVLQYRSEGTDQYPVGFYLYDLGSTHGTFLNKNQIKPRMYVRVLVGHMIKLGCSTRTYILTGPEFDQESESELSVTELKQKRFQELEARKEQEREFLAKRQQEKEAQEQLAAERGIDWGMGEDADETTDLSENPYAQTNNEELYIDDPKKALRGFMEREGIEFEYVCEEQGIGQFTCKVELPIDDEQGKPVYAEVIHKGKKKEAVVQCALEACRILDRHGLLRQATHASRKRKAKNWEENDYYDSDDDTFLDRTGTVEKKRENRMKARTAQTVETYESLVVKEKSLMNEIKKIERQLYESTNRQIDNANEDGDSLDTFMKELNNSKLDKHKISKLRMELALHKKEYLNVIRLVNIAKPADLPPLKPFYELISPQQSTENAKSKGLPVFGKRLKLKVQKPESRVVSASTKREEGSEEEEEVLQGKKTETANCSRTCWCSTLQKFPVKDKVSLKFKEICLKEEERLEKTKHFLDLISRSSTIDCNFESILESYSHALDEFSSIQQKHISDLKEVIEESDKETTTLSSSVNDSGNEEDIKTGETNDSKVDEEKRKKRNQRRMQQRQGKMANEKQKGYKEDSLKEDYNMWLPPQNQTGDGRTNLNERFGY